MTTKSSPKADAVWAYLVNNKTATPAEVAKATGVSYGYVYKLMLTMRAEEATSRQPTTGWWGTLRGFIRRALGGNA